MTKNEQQHIADLLDAWNMVVNANNSDNAKRFEDKIKETQDWFNEAIKAPDLSVSLQILEHNVDTVLAYWRGFIFCEQCSKGGKEVSEIVEQFLYQLQQVREQAVRIRRSYTTSQNDTA